MNSKQFYSDLERMIEVLPPKVAWQLKQKCLDSIVEVVLDIGRQPEIRFLDGKIEVFGEESISQQDISIVLERIEDFTSDNRSGIPGTLHRISAIRNRKGDVIGLTCRVGRVVTGTIDCIRDLVLTEKSILFLGRPGVGKTTKLREIARLLADELAKRVIVVDTSNEIAGDGDVPHPAIGKSRRMQVPSPEKQKDVMIEAVENHTPQVIVVDEIGTEEEALASRTIAERGVMLIATAHGNTLENLIKNPTLSDLVGGVSSVTLGDDEARRRSCQKTVLEREKQPTFDVVIEIQDKDTLCVYPDVSKAVDYMLRGWPIQPETRRIDHVDTCKSEIKEDKVTETQKITTQVKQPVFEQPKSFYDFDIDKYINNVKDFKKIYIYAVSRSVVDKAIERLELNAEVTRNIDEADVVISHKSYAKGGAKILNVAKNYGIPMYYVKTNTMPQIQKALKEALDANYRPGDEIFEAYFDETELALEEAKTAVNKLLSGYDNEIELEPRKQQIRKLQHEFVEKYNLQSVSIGEEPNRRLRVISNDKNLRSA